MAEEKKKRWNRRAYLDDFQKTASGEYVYNGKLHYYQSEYMGRKKAIFVLWLLTILMCAGILAGGFLPAAGMGHSPYVLIPYTAALLTTGEVVYLFIHGAEGMLAGTAAFLAVTALYLCGALVWKSTARKLVWSN